MSTQMFRCNISFICKTGKTLHNWQTVSRGKFHLPQVKEARVGWSISLAAHTMGLNYKKWKRRLHVSMVSAFFLGGWLLKIGSYFPIVFSKFLWRDKALMEGAGFYGGNNPGCGSGFSCHSYGQILEVSKLKLVGLTVLQIIKSNQRVEPDIPMSVVRWHWK